MSLTLIATPAKTQATARVYSPDGQGYSIEGTSEAPDMAAIIDLTIEEIQEQLNSQNPVPLKDIVLHLINTSRMELMGELLIRLLSIFSKSENIRLDIACLISAASLPLESRSDSAVAEQDFHISRQAFSARRKVLMKRLNLQPIMQSKSAEACRTYSLTNKPKSSNSNN